MNPDTNKATINNKETECISMNGVYSVQFGEINKWRDFSMASILANKTDKYVAKQYTGKQMLGQISITLGNDKINYMNSTREATEWNAENIKESTTYRNI